MTKSETAKQLAGVANTQRLESQSEMIEMLSQVGSKKVDHLTDRIATLAESMAKMTDSTRATMGDLQTTAKMITREAETAMEKAKWAAVKIEDQAGRLTLKIWVLMCLTACLTSIIAVTSYELWQVYYGPLRGEATSWRELGERIRGLSPAKRKEFYRLLDWDQKR